MKDVSGNKVKAFLIGPFLADRIGGRDNHFNLIRICAATAVMISHAFAVVTGDVMSEPFRAATKISLGEYAVAVFFGVSGLLIARSFDRRASFLHFLVARVLRLYPALMVALLLTAFVLGPVVTLLDSTAYFSARGTWIYVPVNLTLAFRSDVLPGVFTTNPMPGIVNGPLWSLFYEVTCYGFVVVTGLVGLLRHKGLFAILLAAVVCGHVVSVFAAPAGGIAFKLDLLGFVGFPFALGMAAYVWRDRLRLGVAFAALLWLAPVATLLIPLLTPFLGSAIIVAVVYTTFWLALVPKGPLLHYNALGDFSYGVYIFAYPIQQTLELRSVVATPLHNMLLTAPLMLGCAALSWHFVESPSLARARAIGDGLHSAMRRLLGGKVVSVQAG